MIKLIQALYQASQVGQMIANPAVWKSGSELGTYVTILVQSIFTVLIYFFPVIKDYLTTEMSVLISTVIITILGIVQVVIARITTKKEVGLSVIVEAVKEPK